MSSTIDYKYSEAFEKCAMMSAFESRNAVDANGESVYQTVKIVDQDTDLLYTYFAEAARLLEEAFAPVVTASVYADKESTDATTNVTTYPGFKLTLDRDENRWVGGKRDFNRYLTEALTSYALWRWLADKLPDRAGVYGELWQQMSAAAVNALHRLNAPRKKKRTETGESDDTVATTCGCGCGQSASADESTGTDASATDEEDDGVTVTTPTE